MAVRTIILSNHVRNQLNEYQVEFIEKCYQRIFYIEKSLDFAETSAPIRLLYLKELFTIFEELHKIKFTRSNEGKIDPNDLEKLDQLKLVMGFIRNVLSHFPLFNTWDDIEISQEFSLGMGGPKNGKIYKFLSHDPKRIPVAFRLTYIDDSTRQANIHYPQHLKSSDRIYLKDIVSEQDGALIILNIMSHIF